MKRLLLVGLISCVNVTYALWGLGSPVSPVTTVSNEAAPLLKQVTALAKQIDTKMRKQGLTPAELKRDQQSINDLRNKLNEVFIKANSLAARISPTFIADTKKVSTDLNNLGIAPDKVYPYLQQKLMPKNTLEAVKKLSTADLRKKIIDYKNSLNDTEHRTAEGKKMREILLIFISDYTREAFDAFLQGDDALKKLMITDKKQIEQLQDLIFNKIPVALTALNTADENINALLKGDTNIEYPEQYNPNRFDIVR